MKAPVAVSAEHKYVYVSSGEPRLHVLHMATGVEAWNYPMPEVSMESAPVLWDRYLYIASGKRLICITAAQGRYQWDSMRMGTTTGYPIIGTPVLAPDEKGKDARLYFCCEDGTVNAVNARTGRLFWKAPVKLDRIATCAPTVTRDAVLIGAQNGLLYAVSANEGSKLVWKYRAVPPADITAQSKAVSIASPPVVNEGRVLVLVDEGTLLLLLAGSGGCGPAGGEGFEGARHRHRGSDARLWDAPAPSRPRSSTRDRASMSRRSSSSWMAKWCRIAPGQDRRACL